MWSETRKHGGKQPIGKSHERPKTPACCLGFSLNSSRPKEFVKQSRLPPNSDDEDSTMGKLPPSDDSDG